MKIRLRDVTSADAKLLWEWKNEEGSRQSAFNIEYIPFESHLKWLKNKLNDKKTFLFIALKTNDIPFGQIRFDIINTGVAEVDISIAREYRGKGYGTGLLKIGCKKIFLSTGITTIISRVKKSNVSSIKSFSSAGFKRIRETVYKDQEIVEFKLEKHFKIL